MHHPWDFMRLLKKNLLAKLMITQLTNDIIWTISEFPFKCALETIFIRYYLMMLAFAKCNIRQTIHSLSLSIFHLNFPWNYETTMKYFCQQCFRKFLGASRLSYIVNFLFNNFIYTILFYSIFRASTIWSHNRLSIFSSWNFANNSG